MPRQPVSTSKLEKLIALTFSPRRLRFNLAFLAGAATIATINWTAISGSGALGLSESMPIGVLIAPALGGLVTGSILAYAKRLVHMDSAAGTYAAFAGVLGLIIIVVNARLTGELPENGAGFEKFGPFSLVLFLALIGGFNMMVCFPVTFAVIFITRTLMPGNINKYGWVDDEGLEYVTPGPPPSSGERLSTARSRFGQTAVRYSEIPRRHRRDSEE